MIVHRVASDPSRLTVQLPRIVLALVFAAAVARIATPSTASFASQAPESLALRIIVVGSQDEAERVVEQLKRGEDFATLAKSLSLDPSGANGGLLGRMALSSLRPELRGALQGVDVGQLSGIVRVPTGFAVLTVVPDGDARGAPVPAPRAVAATGSVKYAIDVAGFGVATAALGQFGKPDDWNADPQAICRIRTESLAQAEVAVKHHLSSDVFLKAGPFDQGQAYVLLGQIYAYHGNMAETISRFRTAYDLATSHGLATQPEMEEMLGIAHLHKSAIDQGLHHAPGDGCLLGVKPVDRVSHSADVAAAIDYFTRYLARRPEELEVRWLLNVAHMAAGTYPDRVPPAQLIPASAFASGEDVGRFVDVAAGSGLSSVGSAGGVIVEDFDNDGRLDVVTSSMASCDPLRLFLRQPNGLFVERTSQAGLAGQVGGLNTLQTDYNNDGRADILLMRGGWDLPQRRSLLRNNGDGTFTDVTGTSGLARPATSSQAAVWVDVDNDGWIDLFVGNENSAAQLFRNKGDGTFEDIAARAGVNRRAFSKGVAAGDYDNDGWPDLYVSNQGGPNFLYRNNHDGTFAEVSAAAGVPGPGTGFATWFFDYDNDGWQDLFVTSYFISVDETARTYLRLPHNATTLKLYRNLGNGAFQDVSQPAGLDKVFMPMGANFGDVDNDGFLDIYLGTGSPSYGSLVPSVLLRNKGGTSFVDVTLSSGTGELHKGHGVAFADLDNDGDEEIVFQVGGATPGDAHPLRLFENPGHDGDWLALKLVGVKTNRGAIGARITVAVEGAAGRRVVHRVVGSGGSFGASPLQQHVGLGKDVRTVDVEIWWPTSGTRQRFTNVTKNQVLEITELAAGYRRIERPRLPLGGE